MRGGFEAVTTRVTVCVYSQFEGVKGGMCNIVIKSRANE